MTKRQTNTGQRFIFFNLVTFVSWQFLWLWFTLTTFGHLHRWGCCNPQELHDFQFSICCSRSLLICLSVLRNERHIPNQDKFQFPYSLEATPYSHFHVNRASVEWRQMPEKVCMCLGMLGCTQTFVASCLLGEKACSFTMTLSTGDPGPIFPNVALVKCWPRLSSW